MHLPQGRNPDVVVIGGGVSGLTAAVDLASHGFTVLLVEQKQRCGGRTYSFVHKETGDEVDNGQHLMMGCYHSTLKFLSTINRSSRVTIQKRLSVNFRHAEKGAFRLQSASLPAPANILVGLLRLKSLTLFQRLCYCALGLALFFAHPDTDERLQSMTVEQWLDELHQPKENKELLVEYHCHRHAQRFPGGCLRCAFREGSSIGIHGEKADSSMVIPREGLSSVLVDGAVDYLEKPEL